MTRLERLAQELLTSAKIRKPSVPVERIAKRLNLRIVYDTLDPEISGLLCRQEVGSFIAVNEDHAPTRQRFTIAHEIGHFVLHAGRPLIVDHIVRAQVSFRDTKSSLATDREEIEANGFAAALIMPVTMLHAELAKLIDAGANEHVTINSLAETFAVSEQAMEYRLTNLGLRSTIW